MIVPVVPNDSGLDGDLFVCDDKRKALRILDRCDNQPEILSKNVFMASGLQLINLEKIIRLAKNRADTDTVSV